MASSRVNVALSAKQGSFTATCRIQWWRYAIQIPCGSICRRVRVRVRIARPGTSEVGTRTYVHCHNSSAYQVQRPASTATIRWHYSIRGKAILTSIKYSVSHSPCMALKCPRMAHTDTDWGICNSPWQSFVRGTADHPLFVTSKRRIPDKHITGRSAFVLGACERNSILWEADSY